MTRVATHAGPGPGRHDDGSDDSAHMRALVESERVVRSEAEIDNALDGLAALLLDLHAARASVPTRGDVLAPPDRPVSRPDARRRTARQDPPAVGGEAA